MSKQTLKSKTLLYPMPAVLVAGGHEGEIGLCAIAWIGMVSQTPATIAMGMRNVRHTLALIEKSGEFTVNVPRVGMEASLDFCGIEAGGGSDKWAAAGLTPTSASEVGAPIVAECPMVIECRVSAMHDVGDYRVVFGEVVAIQADDDVLREDGKIDLELLDPLSYVPGVQQYWSMGRKVADAYSVGKPLKEAAHRE